MSSARCMQSYVSEGMTLTIQQVSYGRDADIEAVKRGDGAAISCTATQDGRYYDRRGWCSCGSDDAIYCERWSAAGREFHGWICRECRRLVQAG